MQMPCSNTQALSDYEYNQDLLAKQWELDLPNKQEAVVELAIKLIKQETTTELFNWVFSDYIDDSEETCEHLYYVLEGLTCGDVSDYYSESTILQMALEGACMSLYDCELDEIAPHNISVLTKKVLAGLK
jgi:hypothetical protein